MSDYATIAYSWAGVALWTNRYKDTGNQDDYVAAMAVDDNGNVFVTGYSYLRFVLTESNPDYATIAYSGAGVPLWTNRYEVGSAVIRARPSRWTACGNVFVTGCSRPGG